MSHALVRLLFIAMAVVMGLPPSAFGYPIYSRFYRLKYREQAGCNICHEEGGGSKRNAYGEDWQRSGESVEAFALIERRDSDGDGASNIDELKAGSNPGDRDSTLVRPGHKWHLRHHVPVPVTQIRAALGTASDYGFREVDLNGNQIKQLEVLAGRPLRIEERHPTIYFALEKRGRTGATAIFVYPQVPSGRSAMLVGLLPGGRVRKLFLVRAGQDDVRVFRPFLDCLEKNPEAVSSPERASCPAAKGHEHATREILRAVQIGSATVSALDS